MSFDGLGGRNMKLRHDPSRSQTYRTVVDIVRQFLRTARPPVPATPRTNMWWSKNKDNASSLTRLAWSPIVLRNPLASAITTLFLGILR